MCIHFSSFQIAYKKVYLERPSNIGLLWRYFLFLSLPPPSLSLSLSRSLFINLYVDISLKIKRRVLFIDLIIKWPETIGNSNPWNIAKILKFHGWLL